MIDIHTLMNNNGLMEWFFLKCRDGVTYNEYNEYFEHLLRPNIPSASTSPPKSYVPISF